MTIAITYTEFGGPEVLKVTEVDPPIPGPGQVRIAVRAVGVNPIDAKIRRGDLVGQFPAEFPIVPGWDVAGVVDAVGDDVRDIAMGDEVFGLAVGGSYVTSALAEAPIIKPPGLSWELAASLPTVGEAAFRSLKHLDLSGGETLLIHGAAGSVGAIATQLAVRRGITVIGSVAETDMDAVRQLGGIPVRFGGGLVERVRALAPQGIDAALDTVGHGVLAVSIELAGGPERVLTLVDPAAATYGVRFTGAPGDRAPEAFPLLGELAAAKELTVAIWRSYPLTDAAQAHADLEAGRNHGKLVLVP
jgi:NADPH:quinone reductase-like Zn-dependent oxidoreductase